MSIVVGVGLVVLLQLTVFEGYLLLAGATAVIGTAAVITLPESKQKSPQPTKPSRDGRARRGATAGSLTDRSFRLLLSSRLLINIGNALGTALLLFFLMHGLGQPSEDAQDRLLILILVYTVSAVAASVLGGIVSDRMGRRRELTALAALVQGASGIVILMSPSFPATVAAAVLMGVGYGAYSTIGLALAIDLLPSKRHHARDLGIVTVTMELGQLLGPVLGAGLVALAGGFWMLFAAVAVLSLFGALLTLLIREHPFSRTAA